MGRDLVFIFNYRSKCDAFEQMRPVLFVYIYNFILKRSRKTRRAATV